MRPAYIACLAIAALPATAAGEEPPPRFDLVCLGNGSANRVASDYAWGTAGSANIIGNRSTPFDDQVNLWIEGSEGRIRMPRAMLPPIRGGRDGWFIIRSIKIERDEITASVAINFANNPKLRLDRITGAISISGKAGDYSGTCQKYDPETVQRAF